jgi:serine/threonine protein kinase
VTRAGGTTGPGPATPHELAGRPALKGERYALFGKIAEGGMAGIYRAWDTRLQGWRAVKVLFPEFAQRRKLRTRFESEARAMAAIDHPNVVRVFDVVTDATLPYLVMEIADGGSLNDWLEEHGAMPPRLAVRATEQIARGLAAAHAVGVVHRDVKPQNVLLDRSGRCMVSDFGIARVEFLDSMTRTGTSMGTIGYMAPEQRTDAKVVDVRADVYALGALLYKLLTSVVLTDMFMIGHDAELIEPVPEPLRVALVKACHHDRDDRWPDVDSFVAALLEALPRLPPDPDDVPPLGTLVREAPLDTSSRAFAAISSVLVALPGGRPTLDSTVPMVIGQAGRDAADTTDSDSRTYPAPTQVGGRTVPFSAVPPAPLSSTVTPLRSESPGPTLERPLPPPPVVRERTRESQTSWFWATVASAVGFGAVVVAALGFSVWTLQLAQRRELDARSSLYRAIDADRPALDLVNERSPDPAAIAELLARHASYTTTTGEPARQNAADAYVSLLLEQTAPLVAQSPPGSRAEVQLQNLTVSRDAWRDARQSLQHTRATAPGWWATWIGF